MLDSVVREIFVLTGDQLALNTSPVTLLTIGALVGESVFGHVRSSPTLNNLEVYTP